MACAAAIRLYHMIHGAPNKCSMLTLRRIDANLPRLHEGRARDVCGFLMSGQERPLYVKVQLGAGVIIGRSFHWSKMDVNARPQRKGEAL